MHSAKLFSAALAVGASVVSAQTSTCTKDIKVTEATPVINCQVVDADIIVDSSLGGSLQIDGPKQLKKDLIINNSSGLVSFTSTTIQSVEGTLRLMGLPLLSTFNMQALKSVNNMELVNLGQLNELTLGTTGVTKASSIIIQDTFLHDVNGLNIATVDNMTIANNRELSQFNSKLENVTSKLSITDNAGDMKINMSMLETAGELDFRAIQSFDAPILESCGRLSCQESPQLLSVSANNLTEIKNSLTLDNNKKLANVSFTSLETISGDMTIRNNTDLEEINKFPLLKKIGGAILLTGSFSKVELPKLNEVDGAATVSSTTDISDFCDAFDKLKSKIQGKYSCSSNDKDANKKTKDGKGGSSSSDEDSAAGSVAVNSGMLAVVGLVALTQLL